LTEVISTPIERQKMAGSVIVDFSAAFDLLNSPDADKLVPKPVSWKVLIAMPTLKRRTAGGVLLPEPHVAREETAVVVGLVVAVGPAAYLDTKKFPSGPSCKPGDYVSIRGYSGTRIKVQDVELRVVNDDSIETTVPDPSEIQRL